ncbi:hypothetical protein MUK42_16150 [Musa troglodytarum]|uniref:Uncharacterized protein n=1 Tax=Musa troglodytarum TaxID=320322 RepID=A0A9E7HE62_9LILI|nr:hypothetical protein MUK42_16150 [Musa troglodytarum]
MYLADLAYHLVSPVNWAFCLSSSCSQPALALLSSPSAHHLCSLPATPVPIQHCPLPSSSSSAVVSAAVSSPSLHLRCPLPSSSSQPPILHLFSLSTLEQKKAEENKNFQAIDYDAPIEPEQNTIGLGTKVGVGAAVLVFGLVFAFGDFLPYGSVSPSEDATTIGKKLTEEEKSTFKTKLEEYKEILGKSPEDPTALEGAVVTMEELGDYEQASSLLEKLTKSLVSNVQERPNNADAYRLLGDVKFELKDYDGSASAYKNSLSASGIIDFEVLHGLTNSLLAAKKPGTAVQELLKYREQLNEKYLRSSDVYVDGKVNLDKENLNADPIQVDLLLGKAYSDWGRVSDALAVYDQLISKHPDDFRGYLAKARFFAPEKVKALVDRYSGK